MKPGAEDKALGSGAYLLVWEDNENIAVRRGYLFWGRIQQGNVRGGRLECDQVIVLRGGSEEALLR